MEKAEKLQAVSNENKTSATRIFEYTYTENSVRGCNQYRVAEISHPSSTIHLSKSDSPRTQL
ncbi:hypothetical protein ACTXT7_011973 [Hymenolepis weldensis]